MGSSGKGWTDFVAGIFNIDVDLLQVSERFSQRRHVR